MVRLVVLTGLLIAAGCTSTPVDPSIEHEGYVFVLDDYAGVALSINDPTFTIETMPAEAGYRAWRDDFRPDSDVEMLVECEPDAEITLLDMSRVERELGQIIGRTVDLPTAEPLHRKFRDPVRQQAELVYAR